ncbi:MAG: nitrilase-related carbon-nitrogen hydrolase, partial [Oscillospiraceae bacterium]
MIDGFFKVCADAPQIEVADVYQNAQNIYFSAKKAVQAGVKLLVLPELCLTGVSCGDLFFQPTLQNKAKDALAAIQQRTKSFDMLIVLGLPLAVMGKLFDCSVLLYKGKILGVVPKTNVNANGFNRWFCTPCEET